MIAFDEFFLGRSEKVQVPQILLVKVKVTFQLIYAGGSAIFSCGIAFLVLSLCHFQGNYSNQSSVGPDQSAILL